MLGYLELALAVRLEYPKQIYLIFSSNFPQHSEFNEQDIPSPQHKSQTIPTRAS
jgi:hypothetical protein